MSALDSSLEELTAAYCSALPRKEVIAALARTVEGMGSEFPISARGMWDLRCHYEAIRLLQGMKEEA